MVSSFIDCTEQGEQIEGYRSESDSGYAEVTRHANIFVIHDAVPNPGGDGGTVKPYPDMYDIWIWF